MFNICVPDANTCDITQIAAVCGDNQFSTYVTPTKEITSGAYAKTTIAFRDGVLHHNDEPVDSIDTDIALRAFLDFLKVMRKRLLVAHNGKQFDVKIIARFLVKHELWEDFKQTVAGYCDSL